MRKILFNLLCAKVSIRVRLISWFGKLRSLVFGWLAYKGKFYFCFPLQFSITVIHYKTNWFLLKHVIRLHAGWLFQMAMFFSQKRASFGDLPWLHLRWQTSRRFIFSSCCFFSVRISFYLRNVPWFQSNPINLLHKVNHGAFFSNFRLSSIDWQQNSLQ